MGISNEIEDTDFINLEFINENMSSIPKRTCTISCEYT